ncbi:atypical kinase COQ8B, mitochondrial isoform X1 [Anthonomus grandis grandis]|uniref:atypical kinase COQ8B, mitochondrial isoform X1 n=1 Tax=Anthonomus grandis grandis TaxID=2921223 RepID=UPI0021660CA2|nr:atypical kinase COQ8B, mitochondrial isoform X1 [Anthonomus grandis grandis]
MSTGRDLAGILRALQLILEAQATLQKEYLNQICRTSSIRPTIQQCLKNGLRVPDKVNISQVANSVKDGAERLNIVAQGLKVYADVSLGNGLKVINTEQVLAQSFAVKPNIAKEPITVPQKPKTASVPAVEYQITLTESDKELLKKLDMEHRAKLVKQVDFEKDRAESVMVKKDQEKTVGETILESEAKLTAVPNPKAKLKLNEHAKQRKVPSSRLGRMMSFGSLAAGLGVGAAAEYLKQAFKVGDVSSDGTNLFMNKANMERIVDTLCKVRGAALKLGQILSIQDESIVNPELAKALERVRKSADFMPDWQVEQVMCTELGVSWLDNFQEFERRPFAAASIGQVHYGKLKNGLEVAIKIQYPGVARGIESDIDNLGGIMKMWNIFPKGMFLDNLMVVAKRELAWEVDYLREAECTKKFKVILDGYEGFYVPDVVDSLTTKQVFTTELLDGLPVDQCFDMDYEHRKIIGEKVMDLCLFEILRFRYMQTDPNWANFLYNPKSKKLLLLDFGASREYSKEFMDRYVQVLKGACDGDRNIVLNVSKELGFLTGYESKIMEDAHVDAVMILGEIFRAEGQYDFANQDMTYRIQNLAQTMLVHRLCPPPEEVYSLHRKLSGVFLLLSKLKVKIECRQKFLKLYDEYVRGTNSTINRS